MHVAVHRIRAVPSALLRADDRRSASKSHGSNRVAQAAPTTGAQFQETPSPHSPKGKGSCCAKGRAGGQNRPATQAAQYRGRLSEVSKEAVFSRVGSWKEPPVWGMWGEFRHARQERPGFISWPGSSAWNHRDHVSQVQGNGCASGIGPWWKRQVQQMRHRVFDPGKAIPLRKTSAKQVN